MKQKMKGFTLVEMAIVLLLIAMLGMVAIPGMKMIYKQEAKKAAYNLCLDLVNLRKQAIITGNTYTLEMKDPTSLNKSEYTLSPGITLATGGSSKTLETANNPNISFELEGRTDRKVIFEGRVMKDAAGIEQAEFVIIVRYAGTIYIEILFDHLTGKYTMTSMI